MNIWETFSIKQKQTKIRRTTSEQNIPKRGISSLRRNSQLQLLGLLHEGIWQVGGRNMALAWVSYDVGADAYARIHPNALDDPVVSNTHFLVLFPDVCN